MRVGVLDRGSVLLAHVRAAAEEAFGEVTESVETVDLGRPADFGPDAPTADVLVVGAAETTVAGLRRVRRWRDVHGPLAVLGVATDDDHADQLEREGFLVVVGDPGVADLVALFGDVEVPDDLDAAEEPTEADGAGDEVATTPAAAPAPARPATAGVVLTVASATGGSGKTFFATNLASRIAAAGKQVLLVDLDLQFGEVASALQLRHPYSLYDGLYDGRGNPLPDASLGEHLGELVQHTEHGFDVLAAPRDPALADAVTSDDTRHVVQTVRAAYEVVVVDTPPALSGPVLAALEESDTVVVLTVLDVPSLRNLTSLLEVFAQLGIDEDRLRLVLNKVEPDIGIDVDQAQDAFGGRFVGEIPADRSASRSINSGTVLLRSEPRGTLARAVVRAIEAVAPAGLLPEPDGTVTPLDAPRGRSGGRKLFRRTGS